MAPQVGLETYNPPVNSRIIGLGAHDFAVTYAESNVVFGAPSTHNVSQNSPNFSAEILVHCSLAGSSLVGEN